MRAILALLAVATLATGCSVLEGPHPWPNERRLLAKDWVRPQVEADQAPVYCYRTLGNVECHSTPLDAMEEERMVGTDADVVSVKPEDD